MLWSLVEPVAEATLVRVVTVAVVVVLVVIGHPLLGKTLGAVLPLKMFWNC
jgi:hypothetical protein